MARGHPDDFGFSMFPSYGQLVEIDTTNPSIAVDVEEYIYQISAKGKIYSASIELYCTNNFNNSAIRVAIDGYYAAYHWIDLLLVNGMFIGDGYPVYITCFEYNGSQYHVRLGLRDGLTFGYELNVSIINNEVNIITVVGQLIYARVV